MASRTPVQSDSGGAAAVSVEGVGCIVGSVCALRC
jgi:hypothetical protein